jgi:hypothetical protein
MENLRRRYRLEYLDVDGKIIIKINLIGIVHRTVDWINLIQDIVQGWALSNTVINLPVP